MAWLEDQTKLRRISSRVAVRSFTNNHHRDSCTAPKCQYCARPHDSSLHSIARTDRNQQHSTRVLTHEENYMGNSASYHIMKTLQKKECVTPPRCYLPVARATVIHNKKTRSVLAILYSGTELNVISTKLCNKLGLTGLPIVVNIIGVAANVNRICTKICRFNR